MDYRYLRLRISPPLARVALATPADGNRIGVRALRELAEAAEAIAADDGVRAVVLTAEGDDFCAGWAADALAEGYDPGPDPFGPIAGLPQPVVCAVHGEAVSAGLELALACDIRLCSDGARFALPDTGQGSLPRAGGTQRLARLAGRGVALAVVLAGEELDAQAAYRGGLVAKVVPAHRLASEAEAIAASIAARGPIATKYAKEAIHQGLDMTLDQALRYETDLTIILQTTEDRAEGVRAFVEKREPHFEGR